MSTAAYPVWPASLQQPPRITRIGLSVHHKRESTKHVYRIRGRWLVHFYKWSGSVDVNGTRLAIEPGCVGICPPGAQLVFRYGQRAFHSFAEFELAKADENQLPLLPAMQNLGARFDELNGRFEAAIGWHAQEPARANARLWDVLWALASTEPQTPTPHIHPYVIWAQQHIEAHLSADLRAVTIAKQLGCSADYLSRLFQRSVGRSLSGFVQLRRLRHAQALLTFTSLPINAVGAESGMPDPHVFNKFIRRLTGLSPKQLRLGESRDKPTIAAGPAKR